MLASSKALTLVLAVAASSMNVSYGFLTSNKNLYSTTATTSSSLSMLENSADYSSIMSGNDIPNIAPPPMMSPPAQPDEQSTFFASPSDESFMDIQMASSSSSSSSSSSPSQPVVMSPFMDTPKTTTTATTNSVPAKKVVKFQSDGENGIMMECNRPFPTAHPVTPLSLGQKKARFKPEGIMMAATPSVPKAKKSKSSSSSSMSMPPKESSSTHPNTSTFQWKPAVVTPNGKLAWQQREIDCMPMPAE